MITYALWLQELKQPLFDRLKYPKADNPLIHWTINFCDAVYRPVIKRYTPDQLEQIQNRWNGMSYRMSADRGIVYYNYRK